MAIESIAGGVRFTGDEAKTVFKSLQQNQKSIKGIHFVYEQHTKEIYKHTVSAIERGHPNILTYDADKSRQAGRRKNSTSTLAPKGKEGLERDEYPYASTFQGGASASVMYVPKGENSLQGGQLGALYSQLSAGDNFLVLPVPKDESSGPEIPEIAVAVKNINSTTANMRINNQNQKANEAVIRILNGVLSRAASPIPIFVVPTLIDRRWDDETIIR